MIVCDTGGLLAAYDRASRQHQAAAETLAADPGPWLLPPLVLAEFDYLLLERFGLAVEQSVLPQLTAGKFSIGDIGDSDLEAAIAVTARYRDLKIGLTDASIAVLAARHRTTRLLTLDERHFRAITPLDGQVAFTLLPADRPR
ncbi:MAG: PIN domain-containing protein [Nocardiopsaceae bacterium]|nr:PIN domain-containing protein [Nocardiopsaceae bacterium]